MKPAEHEVAHRLSPIPGAVSRCFPLNRSLTLWSIGGRSRVWHVNPRVQWADRLRWSACNPGVQQAAWAHNPYRVGAQPKRHSAVAVDLRRSSARWKTGSGKERKECPCLVSSNVARCTTLRDEMWVFLGDTQTMCFVTWAMQVHKVIMWLYTLTTSKNKSVQQLCMRKSCTR